MSCYFSLGFTQQMETLGVSHFFTLDSIEQSQYLARTIPDSQSASIVRMFFCLEIAKMLMFECSKNIAKSFEVDLLGCNWLSTPTQLTKPAIQQLRRNIVKTLELFDTVTYEMKVRAAERQDTSHVSADLFVAVESPHFRKLLLLLDEYAECLSDSLLHEPGKRRCFNISTVYIHLLNELGTPASQALVIFSYMLRVNERESIDPWTQKTSIFLE